MKIMTVFGDEQVLTKVCMYCKSELPLSDFPRHSQKKDGFDTRCKACIKKRTAEVAVIRTTAPPMSDVCDCCGKKPNNGPNPNPSRRVMNLVLDHDPVTKQFRGWLCDDCNKSIGLLGDTVEGLRRALRYLENSNG
jgi:Recombination endonuclease VII